MSQADRIALHRRQQPLPELRRKAAKAGRASEEAKDLCFAEWHERAIADRERWLAKNGPERFRCFCCWALGRDWDDEAKVYRRPPEHSPNCYYGPTAPAVYSGTTYTGAKAGPAGRLP